MRRPLANVATFSILLLLVTHVASPAVSGEIWTDGDGDGLPDPSGALFASFGDSIEVDVWIDAQAFAWTNYLAYVEWGASCFEFVSAEYLITGGSNFPIDRFSHPSAVGFGGFGYTEGGIDRVGRVRLRLVAQAACCVAPVIDPDNSYAIFSQLGAASQYLLFNSNPGSCWSPLPGIEACCFPNGTCIEAEIGACPAGSTPRGPATNCDAPCPVQPGACCLPSGACTGPISRSNCEAQGGLYAGDGTDCGSIACDTPTGACCFSDLSCQNDVPRDTCESSGGVYRGDSVSCDGDLCPVMPGACCLRTGACIASLTRAACEDSGGVFQGEGTECGPFCPIITGACCFDNGSCSRISEAACEASSGQYQGDNVFCQSAQCANRLGACCLPSGQCITRLQGNCENAGGVFQGEGTLCADADCSQPLVGCCFPLTGLCSDLTADSCRALGGNPRDYPATCATISCPPPPTGACCFNDSTCVDSLTELECTSRGGIVFREDADCGRLRVCRAECPNGPTMLGRIPALLKEAVSPSQKERPAAMTRMACGLPSSTNGSAANYRWYNVCSGYIWIWASWCQGEGVGVLFGGPAQPEVRGENTVKRAITYFRNVYPNYGENIDIHIDTDPEGDGCPNALLASELNLQPGLRWNCSEFNTMIPCGVDYVVLRTVHSGGYTPTFPTDGPFSDQCAPDSPARSFYYGINGESCVPWRGPGGRSDNFLYWLIVDSGQPCVNSVESTSWGRIKGLFR